MIQMPVEHDNSFGVPREIHNLVARYQTRAYKRDELLTVWFEEGYAEFETVTGERTRVTYEEMT